MSGERVIIRLEYPRTIVGPDGPYQASNGELHYLAGISEPSTDSLIFAVAHDLSSANVYTLEEAQRIRPRLVESGEFFDVSICLVGYESRRPGLTARISEWVRSLFGGA